MKTFLTSSVHTHVYIYICIYEQSLKCEVLLIMTVSFVLVAVYTVGRLGIRKTNMRELVCPVTPKLHQRQWNLSTAVAV